MALQYNLLSLLLSIVLSEAAVGKVLYVKPFNGTSTVCPLDHPCCMIDEYASRMDRYISTNGTTFVFLPGVHKLSRDFDVSGIRKLAMHAYGSSTNNDDRELVNSITDSQCSVVCTKPAMINVYNVSELEVSHLEFRSCGRNYAALSISNITTARIIGCCVKDTLYSTALNILHILNLSIENCSFVNNTSGYGGGVMVSHTGAQFLGENAFIDNRALSSYGGGVHLQNSTVKFDGQSQFYKNSAKKGGGGLYSYYSDVALVGKVDFIKCSAIIGGGVLAEKSSVTFHGNSTFTNNTCSPASGSGGALMNWKGKMEFFGVATFEGNAAEGRGGAVYTKNSKMHLSGNLVFKRNNSTFGGAILIEESVVENNGTLLLDSNSAHDFGGAIDLYANSTFQNSGMAVLSNNTANDGGAINFALESSISLLSGTNISFLDNHSDRNGGAILVYDVAVELYCLKPEDVKNYMQDCFLQVPNKISDIHLFFQGNRAQGGGDDLFGGFIENRCKLKNNMKPFEVLKNITYGNPPNVSSPPFQICLCPNDRDTANCSEKLTIVEVFPGQKFHVTVLAVGQCEGPVPAVLKIDMGLKSKGHISPSDRVQNTTLQCTPLNITAFSKDPTVDITVTANTCGGKYDVGKRMVIRLRFKKCQLPFIMDNSTESCTCHKAKELKTYGVTCEINNQTVNKKEDSVSGWIGYEDCKGQSNQSCLIGFILHHICPFHYCSSNQFVSFHINNTEKQCAPNRVGLLCGACDAANGYSSMLGSARCSKCSNMYLLLLIVFAAAGIGLLILLFVSKITITSGALSGVIFYVNLFNLYINTFIPSVGSSSIVIKVLAWLNLEVGFETCLFNGLDMYAKAWLQFLFPAYILLLVALMISISNYPSWASKMLGTNPVAILATLILLSFNNLSEVVIHVLSYSRLEYLSGEVKSTVWWYDGNITYLEGRHIPLFIFAVLVSVLFIIPYTLLLLLGHWLQAKSDLVVFSWIRNPKWKYFLDNYHAPYKKNHRYWPGLLLVARLVLMLISALNPVNDPAVNLMAMALLIALLLMWMVVSGGIYKNRHLDTLEASFFLNLLLVAVVTFYNISKYGRESIALQQAVGYSSVSLFLLTFVAIVLKHLMQGTRFEKKVSQSLKYLLHWSSRRENSFNENYVNGSEQRTYGTTVVTLGESDALLSTFTHR